MNASLTYSTVELDVYDAIYINILIDVNYVILVALLLTLIRTVTQCY